LFYRWLDLDAYEHTNVDSNAGGHLVYVYPDGNGNSNGHQPNHPDPNGYADRSDLYQHPHTHFHSDPDCYPYKYINTHGYKHLYGDLVGD
jgi:hypothetical protein